MNYLFYLGRVAFSALCIAGLASCDGGGEQPTLAAESNVSVLGYSQGATAFISRVSMQGSSFGQAAAVRYTIAPKSNSVSKAVKVTYEAGALKRRGFLSGNALSLPVFGLYSGRANAVEVEVIFSDGSIQSIPISISTASFVDPTGVYIKPTVLRARAPNSVLGFDFFAAKSSLTGPVILDTDGEVRWFGDSAIGGSVSAFVDGGFTVGDSGAKIIYRVELDGSTSETALASNIVTNFHHNLDRGKDGLLGEFDAVTAEGVNLEATLGEFDRSGSMLKLWDIAAILSAYMRSEGDDPTPFIRYGADWFHMNAATYDARDNSVIVSSRENFVIKLDYETGAVKWILGDPEKYWFTFPSLRAKALTVNGGGPYPIGQHAVSITSDGLLMLFDNGTQSTQQPAGAPVGGSRQYSAVSAYFIDPAARTAQQVWQFDYGQSIKSAVCSSAYEARDKSILIDYAFADSGATARLVGLDGARNVVFDFQYASPTGCGTAWNAIPVPLEDLVIVN